MKRPVHYEAPCIPTILEFRAYVSDYPDNDLESKKHAATVIRMLFH